MKDFVTKNMFWILLFLFLVKVIQLSFSTWIGIGSWNLNRTTGWGWDITNFIWWNFDGTFIFVIGYGYTYFKNRVHHFPLSIIHISLILFSSIFVWMDYGYNVYLFLSIHIATWIVFMLNLVTQEVK